MNPFENENIRRYVKGLQVSKKPEQSTPMVKDYQGLMQVGANTVAPMIGTFIQDGYEGAGSTVAQVGSAVGNAISTVNPFVGTMVNVGSQVFGALGNRAFGKKTNQARLKAANEGINYFKNFTSNAGSFDELKGPVTMGNFQNPYKGGWFRDVSSENDALRNKFNEGKLFADRSVTNNADNIMSDQINNALYKVSAYGGFLDSMPYDMGALEYSLLSDYVNAKKKQGSSETTPNLFAGMLKYALGGVMQAHGSDWSSGLTHIDAGGSHESSPYEGVQMGIDPNGVPNLVEEGEVIWNDFVYSNRITLSDEVKKKYHFPKKKDITYAEAAKRLEKEIQERPNDPISKSGFETQMANLAEEQEKQKAKMEADRARKAFEVLTPEEQTAVMQQLAQQEQMAQQQAMAEAQPQLTEQPMPEQNVPEESMQPSQAMVGAGNEAMPDQTPVIAACGGKINKFPWGGITEMFKVKPPYQASLSAGFIPYDRALTEEEVLKREQGQMFKNWTKYVNDNWDSPEVQEYLRMLDATTGGNHLFDSNGDILSDAKDYFNRQRTQNHKWGYYHLTPTWAEEAYPDTSVSEGELATVTGSSRVFHAMDGDDYDGYIEGALDPAKVGAEVRRETLPNGDTVIYHGRPEATTIAPKDTTTEDTDNVDLEPIFKNENIRYTGLLGPAVGLGMMASGIGRPDFSEMDRTLANAARNYHTASNKYLGNYQRYQPLDIWFEQAKLDAQSRAADRSILNSGANQGTKMAGIIANGYNSQLASGNLFRQAQEYNDALKRQTAEFNRGTDQFNAEAYNRRSQFNAGEANRAAQFNAHLGMQAAREKMEADAGWYNSLYGNVNNLFKGLSDLGTENKRSNMVNWAIAKGLFGNMDPDDEYLKDRVRRKNV